MARKKEELENKNQKETKAEITEQPTEEVEQSSEELVEIEADKNMETVESSVSEESTEDTEEPTENLFPELENIETVESNEFEPIEKENIEIMSLDNKPINKEVVKEPVNIPDKFVKIPKRVEHTKSIHVKNGRVYKELGNGYGIYSDDGSIFKI